DQAVLGLERREALGVEPADQPLHLRHHLGADAVAGQQKELVGRHGRCPHRGWSCSGLTRASIIYKAELPTEPAITGTEKSARSAKALLQGWQATIAAMPLL